MEVSTSRYSPSVSRTSSLGFDNPEPGTEVARPQDSFEKTSEIDPWLRGTDIVMGGALGFIGSVAVSVPLASLLDVSGLSRSMLPALIPVGIGLGAYLGSQNRFISAPD